MLVRGDLGFVAGTVVVFAVIWIVISRKWRLAAARREDIKRLLVLAAEESARAEFEATVQYGTIKEECVSQQQPLVQKNQCALCFSTATKFCSQCKAVRYCSGKCQIIHWRQGHKKECRPYTIFNKGNERKVSSQKEFNQEEHVAYVDSYELDKKWHAKKVETFPEYADASNCGVLHVKNFIKGEWLTNDVESNLSATSQLTEGRSEPTNTSSDASVYGLNDSDVLNRTQTVAGIPVKSETVCVDMDRNRLPYSEKSSNLRKSSIKSGQYKPVCSDGDSLSFSCSSSGWSVDGSNDSLSEPSTPSSEFWEGTINSRRDGVHGVTTCSSNLPTDSTTARTGLKSTMLKVVDQLKPSKISKHYSRGGGSDTSGNYTVKGLFSYELFVKLYNWNKVDMQPCGLINCGNSCYANVVLQCLAFTPPITAYLLQRLHSKTCQSKDWCFTCEFENLFVKAKEGNTPLSPIRILSHIENIGSHLDYGKEEDAHEFLRCAIDTLQSSCLKEAVSNSLGSLNEETTLIGITFGGYLQSKIKCLRCGGKSERNDRIMDLTVEIDGNICTLEEALRKFTSTEILDGQNKYNCSRCKSYEKAKKKLTIVEAPNVLTIVLKRFQSGKLGKLSKSIQFPEVLNMVPFMSSTSDMSPIYRLYGVVVHLDIMNASFSGHYICYVKNIQNKWFKIDDSSVNVVELDSVLTKGAYMLLYARCSPQAPKLMRNSIVPRDPRKLKNPSLKARSHSTGPCDSPKTDHLNYQTSEGFYQNHSSFQRVSSNLEDDLSSDNSSSIFSEAGSCSTESSSIDSVSTDDYFDQIFGDSGHNWNGSWWNTSDSDTSSSSSSPSPLYTKNIPCTSSDHYATSYSEESPCSANPAESAEFGRVWRKQPGKNSNMEILKGKGSIPILHSDKTKQFREVDSNSSCSSHRETNLNRLRKADNVKFGISHKR